MAEIEKIAVYDSRIIQDPPKYAVQKGALSVSTSKFQANAANASQLSFQVLVPSLNVFTDRKIELNASAYCYAEAVPTQQITAYDATTQGGVTVPAGRYIDPPFTTAQQYTAQDLPIAATFPSDGSSWNSQGNTACVLPANSWPGLTENLSQSQLSDAANVATQQVFFASTMQLTNSDQPAGPFTNASLVFPNAFRKFDGGQVAGVFSLNYNVTASLPNSVYTNYGFVQMVVAVYDPITTTIFGTAAFDCTTDEGASNTGGRIVARGTVPLSINSSVIDNAAIPNLQIRISTFSNSWEVGGSSAPPLLTHTDTFFSIAGFNLSVIGDPTYLNWYQSVGSPSDLSLGMFPIQSLATSMTATINDCSVSVSGDVLHEQLLLSQTRESLMQRTCPSKYDVYAWTSDDVRSANGAIQAYDEARDSDIPNASYPIQFVSPKTGLPLAQFDAYRYTNSTGQDIVVPIINYRPVFIPQWSNLIGQALPVSSLDALPGQAKPTTWTILPTNALQAMPIMFRFSVTEPLCLSPFLWQDSKQMTEVGLYGITNMTVNMTLQNPGAVVGYETGTSATAPRPRGRLYMDKLNNSNGSYGYMTRQSGINALYGNMRLQPPQDNAGNQTGPWVDPPQLRCTFLTPPPEITLPLVSSVPYVEFPRYSSTSSVTFSTTGTALVQSNTVTLSSIPDLLVVFVKPAYRGQTQGDTYIPITNIGVTFDNYANLCSNFSQEDLYAASVAGGLDMDYNQFRGFARGRQATLVPKSSGIEGSKFDTYIGTSSNIQLTGAPVVLRMGQDVPLSSGLAPGTLGNYSVQVAVTIDNSNGFFSYLAGMPSSNNVIVTVMGVNSGFFESVRGSSALRKTILNTTDVESASTSSSVTSSQLVRLVGGASGMHTSSRLTTSLGMPQFKPAMGDEPRMRKMARHSGSMIP
jgi:hypothetical protein